MSIGVAVLGAGIFAKTEHLPAIKSCPSLSLKAVYSRSQTSAERFAATAGEDIEAYFESPSVQSKSLDDLLQRQDIVAVIIAVAITAAPDLIQKALAAGKHVLSEKPIAPDVETAQRLMDYHHQQTKGGVLWGVGENFRFWDSVQKAARILTEMGGSLVTFSMTAYSFTDSKNPFYHSDWRQKPTFQGGYLLDGGVHFAAVVRTLLAALGQRVEVVSAYTTSLQEELPPLDTVHAILRTNKGRSGTYTASVGIQAKRAIEFEIVTDKGYVIYRPFQMEILIKQDEGGRWEERSEPAPLMWGVKEEIAAFAASISTGRLDSRLSTTEALEDLKIVEAMLRSGDAQALPVDITKGTT
ncbi:oxidoreductase [Aspergillus arachidicola]|uniref:Oxidoreductase n=1 Tax=Aspergillus arachidicola TaxID=656916 RepID=A0A2G7GAQ4_9EURO|nr:oxidoreductase [Aspergillus arachidicola]